MPPARSPITSALPRKANSARPDSGSIRSSRRLIGCNALSESDHVAVGIGNREFLHPVPLRYERHHDRHTRFEAVVQRLDAPGPFEFDEHRSGHSEWLPKEYRILLRRRVFLVEENFDRPADDRAEHEGPPFRHGESSRESECVFVESKAALDIVHEKIRCQLAELKCEGHGAHLSCVLACSYIRAPARTAGR